MQYCELCFYAEDILAQNWYDDMEFTCNVKLPGIIQNFKELIFYSGYACCIATLQSYHFIHCSMCMKLPASAFTKLMISKNNLNIKINYY